MSKYWWIVVVIVVICLLAGVAVSVARSLSGLDKKEMAVVRRAAGESPFVGSGGGDLVGLDLVALILIAALWWFTNYKHRSAVKKAVGFDPRKRDRAEGVIFSFYELRITRTELIKGYDERAQRRRLEGLTATATTSDVDDLVSVKIEGPGTNFVYSVPRDALTGFNPKRARQFAALLNYEARIQKQIPMTPRTRAPHHPRVDALGGFGPRRAHPAGARPATAVPL
ncbi:hypothetical protein BST11_06195 [Mycobacterium alsense]|uniref:Uncharacterized protein n=1 Tax=Mycobacterium alsense TaxID=324058 RepID=A0AA41XRI8_9MYCO|nr:hypothetical protein [Mycobacterium alsense]MCV7380463.1 hypothetical protein [Mycobacterium alsense]OQZ92090.1 hypothetical protein BST11_06195 [Mycobacterium alsense]